MINSPAGQLGLGLIIVAAVSWYAGARCLSRRRPARFDNYGDDAFGPRGDRDARLYGTEGDRDAREYGKFEERREASMPPSPKPWSEAGGPGGMPQGGSIWPRRDDWLKPPQASNILDWFGLRQYGGSATLRASLRELGSSRQLWLTDIDDESTFYIADALTPGHAQKLEMMRIGRHMGPDGCAALADALGRGGAPVLQALHLSGNALGDDGVAAVAYDLLRAGGCPRLRDLQLNHCEIGDAGASALGEALRDGAAPELQNLWLGGNMIGDYGADVLAEAITPGPGGALGLKRLALYSNAIGDAGALAVARAIEARSREGGGSYDGRLPALTVMLFGHQIADEATIQMITEVDAVGARQGGDRIELWAPEQEQETWHEPDRSAWAYPGSPQRPSPSSMAPSWSSPPSGGYHGRAGTGLL